MSIYFLLQKNVKTSNAPFHETDILCLMGYAAYLYVMFYWDWWRMKHTLSCDVANISNDT